VARPFDLEAAAETRRLVGLLGRKRTAAIREVEGLFAACECVRDVRADQVEEATLRHGVDLKGKHRGACRDLYRRFLQQCLDDQRIEEEERADLAHLKTVLQLSSEDVATVHDQVARAVYGRALEHVLEDHHVDPDEADFLRELREELELAEPVAERLYEKEERRARDRYFSKTVSTESGLLASREAQLELRGTSKESLEQAVNGALEEASRAVPGLGYAEIRRVGVKVEGGRVAEWQVDLKARLAADG
jgi:flavin-binding protein dodecin